MYNKQDLAEAVLKTSQVSTKVQAHTVVEAVFESIIAQVQDGERVSIAGFGIFSKRDVKARTGRNPRTGEAVSIKAHGKVKFAPALGFKEAVK